MGTLADVKDLLTQAGTVVDGLIADSATPVVDATVDPNTPANVPTEPTPPTDAEAVAADQVQVDGDEAQLATDEAQLSTDEAKEATDSATPPTA